MRDIIISIAPIFHSNFQISLYISDLQSVWGRKNSKVVAVQYRARYNGERSWKLVRLDKNPGVLPQIMARLEHDMKGSDCKAVEELPAWAQSGTQ